MRALLGQQGAPIPAAAGDVVGDPTVERYYRQLGQAHVARFACQHSYPADATIGPATFGRYTEILALLIGWLHLARDRSAAHGAHTPMPQDEQAMSAALAGALAPDPA